MGVLAVMAAPQGIEWYQPPGALGLRSDVATPPCFGCYSIDGKGGRCKYDFLKCIPVVVIPSNTYPKQSLE